MIKAVIFDLDNTLYDEDLYFFKVFELFCRKHGIDVAQIEHVLHDNVRLKSKDIFSDILKEIDYYSKERQNELFEIYKTLECELGLYDDAYKILYFLKEKNIKLAIITNGVIEAQKNKIKSLKINNLFDNIIYAREFGKEFEKPHKKSFLKTLEVLNCTCEESVFVGDNPNTDIKGAHNAKILGIQLNRGYAKNIKGEQADFYIDNLLELKNILGSKI